MNSTESLLCIGFVPYTSFAPSLAEPLFSQPGSTELFVQEIDEVTNRICGFRSVESNDQDARIVTSALKTSLGEAPVYCLQFEEKPPAIGTAAALKPYFLAILADDSSPVGLKIQVAEIIGIASSRKKAKEQFDREISVTNPSSGMAYHRSVARTALWRKLSSAAIDHEARQRFILSRSFADVEVGLDGTISLELGDLQRSDFPSIDFDTLAAEIEKEIGRFDFATNDNRDAAELRVEEEISADSLKRFLNDVVGPDGRITRTSYFRTVRLLDRLGFASLEQVHDAIRGYNGLELGYLIFGNRQGQITKFELMLLASLGEQYILNTPWSSFHYYTENLRNRLKKIEQANLRHLQFDLKADTAKRKRQGYLVQAQNSLQLDFF